MSDPIRTFIEERKQRISNYADNDALQKAAASFNVESNKS